MPPAPRPASPLDLERAAHRGYRPDSINPLSITENKREQAHSASTTAYALTALLLLRLLLLLQCTVRLLLVRCTPGWDRFVLLYLSWYVRFADGPFHQASADQVSFSQPTSTPGAKTPRKKGILLSREEVHGSHVRKLGRRKLTSSLRLEEREQNREEKRREGGGVFV